VARLIVQPELSNTPPAPAALPPELGRGAGAGAGAGTGTGATDTAGTGTIAAAGGTAVFAVAAARAGLGEAGDDAKERGIDRGSLRLPGIALLTASVCSPRWPLTSCTLTVLPVTRPTAKQPTNVSTIDAIKSTIRPSI
jgi:hypothetical protein